MILFWIVDHVHAAFKFLRHSHWPTQQIHPVDWITVLKLKPIEFKWNTKKPESDCRASRYLKDNDKLKTIKKSDFLLK